MSVFVSIAVAVCVAAAWSVVGVFLLACWLDRIDRRLEEGDGE